MFGASCLLFTHTPKHDDCSFGINLWFIILPKDTSTQLPRGQKPTTDSPISGFDVTYHFHNKQTKKRQPSNGVVNQ